MINEENLKTWEQEHIELLTSREMREWLYRRDLNARPQGEWFDCIDNGTLKARYGDYVLYKVDFLLDNLTREVYIMEGVRRMRGKEK